MSWFRRKKLKIVKFKADFNYEWFNKGEIQIYYIHESDLTKERINKAIKDYNKHLINVEKM